MKEINISIKTYSEAFQKLSDGLVKADDDELYRDGVIQRFEFTFEQFWKTLRQILKYEGLECRSPRSCIKEAFKNNIIVDGEIFLDMLDDRNRTSHIYDEETSIKIFNRIKNDYQQVLRKAEISFKTYLERNK